MKMVPRPKCRWRKGRNGWRFCWLGKLLAAELLEEPGGFWGGPIGSGRDKLNARNVRDARKEVEDALADALGWPREG